MELLESIGDSNLTVGWRSSRSPMVQRRRNRRDPAVVADVIDLAEGDSAKGAAFGVGSPLAIALAFRGVARWWLGRPGWGQDLHGPRDGPTLRRGDPALVVAWTYGAIHSASFGPTTPHCAQARRRCGPPGGQRRFGVAGARLTLGLVLLHREAAAERNPGCRTWSGLAKLAAKSAPSLVPVIEISPARERARRGDRDAALP